MSHGVRNMPINSRIPYQSFSISLLIVLTSYDTDCNIYARVTGKKPGTRSWLREGSVRPAVNVVASRELLWGQLLRRVSCRQACMPRYETLLPARICTLSASSRDKSTAEVAYKSSSLEVTDNSYWSALFWKKDKII